MATTGQARTQANINGLLSQLGMDPVAGRMPRIQPLAPLAPTASATMDALAGGTAPAITPPNIPPMQAPTMGRPPRLTPLVAQRMPTGGGIPGMAQAAMGNIGGPFNLPKIAANSVDDLAAQALGLGGAAAGAGAAGRLGAAKGLIGKASGAAGKLPFPKGALGRGAAGLGIGFAGDIAGEAAGGDDSILGRFLKGAGTGGGLGAIAGPKGALVGGLVAGIGNAIFGGGDDEGGFNEDKVTAYMESIGMGMGERGEMMSLYELEKEALDEATAKNNLLTRLSTIAMEREAEDEQAAISAQQQQQMLASQALAGQFFAPFAQNMVQSAQQRYQMLQNVLPTLPENFRGIASAQAASSLDNATRMATAYQAQAQMIPAMAAFESQQGQINNIASQLLQQGIQNAITPQTGGSLQELLAQVGQGQ